LIWRVGNEQSIRIRDEKWLPLPTTYKVQSPLTTINEEARVCELIEQDTHLWNVSLIKEAFNAEECKAIQMIHPSLTNQPDVQIWRGTAKGEFSVSSAYHMAKELENKDRTESSSQRGERNLWSAIWVLDVQNAWKNFMWRCCHNLLPTKENLVKKKVLGNLNAQFVSKCLRPSSYPLGMPFCSGCLGGK
jgi:hypothetical protein